MQVETVLENVLIHMMFMRMSFVHLCALGSLNSLTTFSFSIFCVQNLVTAIYIYKKNISPSPMISGPEAVSHYAGREER